MVRYTEQWLAQHGARATKLALAKAAAQARIAAGLEAGFGDVVLLSLPWPPTGNHATSGPRRHLTEEHKAYRERVARIVIDAGNPHVRSPFCAVVYWYPPDKRRRDSDNCQKSMFDALKCAGVIADDSMIDRPNYSEHVRFDHPSAGSVRIMLWGDP